MGYIISGSGIAPNPAKIDAIKRLPTPSKLTELRTFLGMEGYYRQVIPNYATIAYPLVNLTKKNILWAWTNKQQNAFDTIKYYLTSDTILAFPQTDRPYKLYTDASDYAVGAILVQSDDHGVERVVHYLSHTLDQTQQRYPVIEREAYAIVYALKKLRTYLWGANFEIITDHKPLKALFADEIDNTKHQRWAIQISEFGAPIRYRCGKDNARADMLSRVRIPEPLPVLIVEWDLPLVFDKISKEQLIEHQKLHFPELLASASTERTYALNDGILVSTKRPNVDQPRHPRVVLPPKWHKQVTMNRHIQAGHAAYARTLYHVQLNYVWPGMCKDIKQQLHTCGPCKLYSSNKAFVQIRPMPIAHYPHQIVAMDIVGPLPRSRSGHNYLLTFIDHLTGWADAFPIPHKTGSKVANVLLQCYLPRYGLPEEILSDNGLEFCNSEVQGLLRQYGIKHQKSTIYHPHLMDEWRDIIDL